MTFIFYKDKEDLKKNTPVASCRTWHSFSGNVRNELKASILSLTNSSNADIPLWEKFSESLPPARENWYLESPIFSDLKCSSLLGHWYSSDLALNHFWLFLKECASIKKEKFLNVWRQQHWNK